MLYAQRLSDKLVIGFVKIEDESRFGVMYERKESLKFKQVIDIHPIKSKGYILLSYDSELGDSKKIGNTCVGLTVQELKLFYKKIKQLRKRFR